MRPETTWKRREFLRMGSALAGVSLLAKPWTLQAKQADGADPTEFQLACMTLPFRAFPLRQALLGIKAAGFDYVAWGTTHRESAAESKVPVMPLDAPPDRAKDLAVRCRDLGLVPLMMFSTIYPEHKDGLNGLTHRVKQAAAAGIPQVLTFGHTEGDNRAIWLERFRQLGPIARDHGVTIVVKQHGGSTGTGEACAEIVREVDDPGVMVNYDAGNVMDYLNVDPIPDIHKCADVVRSFCLKDHRNWPKDEDCGPGFGEIDHYRLLEPVAFTGRPLPLCFENIFAPLVPRPDNLEGTQRLARQVRQYVGTVIEGLQLSN